MIFNIDVALLVTLPEKPYAFESPLQQLTVYSQFTFNEAPVYVYRWSVRQLPREIRVKFSFRPTGWTVTEFRKPCQELNAWIGAEEVERGPSQPLKLCQNVTQLCTRMPVTHQDGDNHIIADFLTENSKWTLWLTLTFAWTDGYAPPPLQRDLTPSPQCPLIKRWFPGPNRPTPMRGTHFYVSMSSSIRSKHIYPTNYPLWTTELVPRWNYSIVLVVSAWMETAWISNSNQP